jgi:hypothetical protein
MSVVIRSTAAKWRWLGVLSTLMMVPIVVAYYLGQRRWSDVLWIIPFGLLSVGCLLRARLVRSSFILVSRNVIRIIYDGQERYVIRLPEQARTVWKAADGILRVVDAEGVEHGAVAVGSARLARKLSWAIERGGMQPGPVSSHAG